MRIINLFGGPNSGKSTTAALLYAQMKMRGYRVELAREYFKDLIYAGTENTVDQHDIFKEQLRRNLLPLKAGVDFVVTDSPALLSGLYGVFTGIDPQREMISFHQKRVEPEFPSLNFFLEQKGLPFEKHDRIHNQKESGTIHALIRAELDKCGVSYEVIPATGRETLVGKVVAAIATKECMITLDSNNVPKQESIAC